MLCEEEVVFTYLKKSWPKFLKGFDMRSHAREVWALRRKWYPAVALWAGWILVTALVDASGVLDAYQLSSVVSLGLMPVFMMGSLVQELFSSAAGDGRLSYGAALWRLSKSVALIILFGLILGICLVPAFYAFDLLCLGQAWHVRLFGLVLGIVVVSVSAGVAFELLGLGTCVCGFIFQGKPLREALSRGRVLFIKQWPYFVALQLMFNAVDWCAKFLLSRWAYASLSVSALLMLLYGFLVFSYHKRLSRLPVRS